MTVLELSVDRSGETGLYDVGIVQSPVGEASAQVAIDCERLMQQRDLWQQAVLASTASTRRLLAGPEATVREVGQNLFDLLLGHPVIGSRYRSSVDAAAERGEPLRLVLRLSAPELTPLPWEAMYDAQTGTYVARSEPLVRHVPVATAPPPLRVQQPMRILGISASPRGLPALDAEAEEQYLVQALAEPLERGQVELHWAREATWDCIHDTLLSGEWHIVHFIGHGDFDAQLDEGLLALVGHDGRAQHVEASRFADLLHEASPMPRLVVLNSCLSAVSGSVDLFAGTASALVRGGVSAVVAMQFEITDPAAAAFARGFYSAIAAGRPVDQAVRSGRVSILGMDGRTLEWITPVLYIRGRETRLFSIRKQRGAASHGPVGRPVRPGGEGTDTPPRTETRTESGTSAGPGPSDVGPRLPAPPAAAEQRVPAAPPKKVAAGKRQRRPRRRLLLLFLLVLVPALAWVSFVRATTVEVDAAAYLDRPVREVAHELSARGLTVRPRGQAHGSAEGTVLAIGPTGRVERGTTITVVHSTGPGGLTGSVPGTAPALDPDPSADLDPDPGPAPAPDVVDLPRGMVGRQAQPLMNDLIAMGVRVNPVEVTDTDQPPGTVVYTDPVGGTPVQQNSTVTIGIAQ